ncbi:hypothetical protein ACW73L_03540 [Methylolobus aquaticus]
MPRFDPPAIVLLATLSLLLLEAMAAAPPTRPPACSGLPPTADFIAANHRFEALYDSDRAAFRAALTDFVTRHNNLGSTVIRFPRGPKTVFRSSLLARNPACLEQLVKRHGVRTIVNLYSGDLIAEGALAAEEADAFTRFGGLSYIRILGLSDYPTPTESIADIKARIASAIELIRAAPGNVLVHCVGGIHRTGEVYGVLQKCFNRVPVETIRREYVYHAGGATEGNPEYRGVDVDIIRSFDCRRLAP